MFYKKLINDVLLKKRLWQVVENSQQADETGINAKAAVNYLQDNSEFYRGLDQELVKVISSDTIVFRQNLLFHDR